MKKFIYLMVIVLLSSCVVPKAGYTSVMLRQKIYEGNDWYNYCESGFYAGIEFNEHAIGFCDIMFQPSIFYIGGVQDLAQVHAPIQFKYSFSEDFGIKAGPSIGILTNKPMFYKSLNLGFDAGLFYEFSDNLKIESDYSFGLSNLSDDEMVFENLKVSNVRVGLAYRF